MHDKLMEKLQKKGKKLEPMHKKAKLDVLKDLSSQAGDMIKSKISGGLKKPGAMPKDSEEGLKKANEMTGDVIGPKGRDPEKLVEEAEEEMGGDLDHDMEAGESIEHASKVFGDAGEDKDPEDCSPEELDEQIKKLQDLKQAKLAKA